MVIRAAFLAVMAALMLVAVACGAAQEPTPAPTLPALFPTAGQPGPAGPKGAASDLSLSVVSTAADRLIVRTVAMSLLVQDVPKAMESITSLAGGVGGFVVSSQVSGEEETQFGLIVIRVPADQTDAALAKLRAMAVRVTSEKTSSQDVTEEYVDLQARLKNLERTEEQYLRLLERAQNVEDTLKVQQQLSSVQGQIEQLKGRMQYLERTSATSLINVELHPASSAKRLVEPGWSPLEITKSAVRALVSASRGLAGLAIWIAVLAPVWAPLGAAAWFLSRWLLKRARAGRFLRP